MIIYKITNLINNKVYIGLTTKSLTYRWSRHLTEGRNLKNQKPLYRAIRKYGKGNFQIEEIDSAPDIKTLGELERYYIKCFNSEDPKFGYNLTSGGERNQWDANPSSKLSYEEVVQIRKIYASQESTLTECYKTFSSKISRSGFEKVWEGATWSGVLSEVYTSERKRFYNKTKARTGETNGNSIYSSQEVLDLRKYYTNHTLLETFQRFGKTTLNSFREVVSRSYKNIPIYHKLKKQWTLGKEIIDINNYKL